MILETLISLLLLLGGAFTLIGSVGLVRLPDFFTRLHGPTKATTLGVGSTILASLIYFSVSRATLSLHELLVVLFLFITAPISAYLLAKTALHLRERSLAPPPQRRYHRAPEERE